MGNPWEPELAVSTDLARRLIADQFPELAGEAIEPYGHGWDNVAFLVGGQWVFRFPQRELARETMEGELACLLALPAGLPLAIPRPRFVGRPGRGYPWPFSGYRELPGQPLCSRLPSRSQPSVLAAPLARFLRALHGLEVTTPMRSTLHGDRLHRSDLQLRIDTVRSRLAEIAALPPGIQASDVLERIQDLASTPPWGQAPVVVHGDLYGRHVLVNEGGQPTGVIDWGDAHLGDPALDLSAAYTLFPANARPTFFEAYGSIDADCRRRAQHRALLYGVTLLHYGQEAQDPAMAQLGRGALVNLIDPAV